MEKDVHNSMLDTEALEVLNFLARRAGYGKFTIASPYRSSSGKRVHVAAVWDASKPSKGIVNLYECSSFDSHLVEASSADSYAEVLEKMLEASSDGKAVMTPYDMSMIPHERFMPPHTSLEQLLVEMDLERQ